MPEVDSESLVPTYAGGNNERKISCETLAITAAVKPAKPDDENELPPDFPPESFYLSKDAELDWFDNNAFLERKESAKGNSIQSTNLTLNLHTSSNSTSQRLPLSTKTTFFGLPNSLLKSSSTADSKRKSCKPANIRFFPTKRSESALKAVSAPEPVSPKVSCMGRVRSKKNRLREAAKKCEKSLESNGVKRKTGFYSRVFSMFSFGRSHAKPVKSNIEKTNDSIPEPPVQLRKSRTVREVPEAVSEPAGLGGMMRFKSGRRSGSWAADEINVVLSESGSQQKNLNPGLD